MLRQMSANQQNPKMFVQNLYFNVLSQINCRQFYILFADFFYPANPTFWMYGRDHGVATTGPHGITGRWR